METFFVALSKEVVGFIYTGILQGIVVFLGIVFVISFPIWLIGKMGDDRGYNSMDPFNLAFHTGIWILFWIMKICGSWGYSTGPYDSVYVPGAYPILSVVFLLLLFCIPLWRTNREVHCLPVSLSINIVQSLIGFIVGAVLMVLMMFNNKSGKE